MDHNKPISFPKIDPANLMPGLSIDCVIIGFDLKNLNILVLKWQDLNFWALPGGFIHQDEDMDLAATRILEERSGISLPYLFQFHTFGNVDRRKNTPDIELFDPANEKNTVLVPWLKQRFISTGYLSLVDMRFSKPMPDLLSESCQWKPLNSLPELLFDHKKIVNKALEQIRIQINHLPIGLSLLPDKFTMKDLQTLYESILNIDLDRGNFQKKMLKLGFLNRLEKQHTGASHKAPYLYSFNKERYNELLNQGIGYMMLGLTAQYSVVIGKVFLFSQLDHWVISNHMGNSKRSGVLQRMLNWTERVGNALPHPATLFALFALTALLVSALGHFLAWEVIHPGTKEIVRPVNLLSQHGIHRILLEMVDNFTGFAPLGIVLVAMLGIGIAEQSGIIHAMIRLLVLNAPGKILTFVIVFTGIISNMAADVGYVLLIPLAGVIFLAVGRHPVVGMAAAFAGVSGGFSANLILGTVDPLLAGLSTEAAQILDPSYEVNPTANYFFMVASTFVIAITGTFVTERIVAPRLGTYQGEVEEKDKSFDKLSKVEKKGLLMALIVFVLILTITLIGMIPENGFFRGEDGGFLSSPLIKGVVAMLFITAGGMGLAYGFTTGAYKNDSDVINGMADSMKTLATYLVLVFFAAQFVAYFKWSNLGIIMAVKGANLLMSADIGLIPLMILFILLSATINMLMGSASAKWAILAPIFIPMFMIMGYSPELSQVVYRIGDSVTNVISPMMSFFALIIAFIQKYDPKAGIGTIIATMIPYSMAFLLVWILLLIAWLLLGLPLGPDAGMHYVLPG